MKRVAIFGNTGGGKSTLAKQLAAKTHLPRYSLDLIKYRPGGAEIPHDDYLNHHRELLQQQEWIIDGFGCVPSTWERMELADTLVYIDLPLPIHAWWVCKRFAKGYFVSPEGWPERSSILKSTLYSFRVLKQCHEKLTPRYRAYVEQAHLSKTVVHLKSRRDIKYFLDCC